MTRCLLCLVLALGGCSSDESPAPPAGPPLIFDTDVRASYVLVRDCRFPGEHSGLDAYTVWVNKLGESSFSAIWKDPPAVKSLAAGAVVVKELYSGTDCNASSVDRWVAMEKRPGFDPGNGDWYWQEVTAARTVKADGADAACIQCHTGNDPSCDGYGLAAGRDYLCTAPP